MNEDIGFVFIVLNLVPNLLLCQPRVSGYENSGFFWNSVTRKKGCQENGRSAQAVLGSLPARNLSHQQARPVLSIKLLDLRPPFDTQATTNPVHPAGIFDIDPVDAAVLDATNMAPHEPSDIGKDGSL